MRYGIRYNPNKKMVEFLDIDEIEPCDILGYIDASDFWEAQKKFADMVKDMSLNSELTTNFFNNYGISFNEATRNALGDNKATPQNDTPCL